MGIKKKIRVLVVDDSFLFRETIVKELSKDNGIEVVAAASDVYMARDKILSLKPDVMTLDVEMPKMDGVEFVKKLMPQYPMPIVMVSSRSDKVFEALNAGAVDFVVKPDEHNDLDSFINELAVKIKIASTAKVGKFKAKPSPKDDEDDINKYIIAIGASTGGTEAIFTVLKSLPSDLPGIVITQHMPPVFTQMFAERLNNSCNLEVREAKDGDVVQPGLALIAPGGKQMELSKKNNKYFVKCFDGDKVNGHCPSVDVLFDSVSRVAKDKAMGVILTGMGSDGAKGLLKMKKEGATTVGQNEETCVVYGMPMVAYNIGAVEKQIDLEKIDREIISFSDNIKS